MLSIPYRIAPHLDGGAGPVRSPAGIASTCRRLRARKPVDFLIRNCGLSLPMLVEKIGTASVPVKTTPIRITAGPAEWLDNRMVMRIAKPSSRSVTRRFCPRGSVSARAGPVG